MNYTATTDVRARFQPSTANDDYIAGVVKAGTVVDAEPAPNAAGWLRWRLPSLVASVKNQWTPYVYALAVYFKAETVTPPPPTVSGDFKLGINALQNTGLLRDEFNTGCRYGLVMNDFMGAWFLKRDFPDSTVIARRYFPQNFFMTDDQLINGLDGMSFQMVYHAYNEADQGGQDGRDMFQRLQQDVRLARHMKRIHGANYRPDKAFYIGGTFSMGTPEFFNEPQATENARLIRESGFTDAYNAGEIGLDMHLYIQNPQQIDRPSEWIYFSRRWEMFFKRAGLNPNVRNVHCTETGLDQGGIGGFPAHGATQQYFRDWCRKYIALQRAPLVIDGVSYPSPIRGGAIFQLGGNGDPRWAGYNIAQYLPVLREFYQA